MPQQWEQGSAARQPAYEEATNPFLPIDYQSRLKTAGQRGTAHAGAAQYQPGQLYRPQGTAAPQPAVQEWNDAPVYGRAMPLEPGAAYSPPPVAAPQMELPSYLQQPSAVQAPYLPPQPAEPVPVQPQAPAQPRRRSERAQQPVFQPGGEPGMPYSAALFEHQQTAVVRNPYDKAAYTAQPTQPFFEEYLEWPYAAEEEQESAADMTGQTEPQLRDAFTPASSRKQDEGQPQEPDWPPRPPIRIWRVAAIVAAVLMLLFCGIVGGRIVIDLTRTEHELAQAREEYREQTGRELYNGAARVDLLPAGQTYQPTASPTPTLYQPTPTPTPIIPINEASVLSKGSVIAAAAVQCTPSPEPTVSLRSRQTVYAKNPLCNIQESLYELHTGNGDVAGRLVIDGVMDEIVMQRNNTYYLTRNSLGSTSEAGAVFVDESCSIRMPPENLLLRGQSSVPGKVFAPLWQFVSGGTGFVSSAATAQLTTLYEEETYLLFAVIVADSDPASSGYFNYASHPTFDTDESMLSYVQSARQRSLYQFQVDVNAQDRLLTLATLGGDSSLVLLYRMARAGEV